VLFAYLEVADDFAVPHDIGSLKIIQEAPAFPDHAEKSDARMMILPVQLKMRAQFVDPHSEQGNLDFGFSAVGRCVSELPDDLGLGFAAQGHGTSLLPGYDAE
jgi:hypothetical protein